jgi:hypothetical protein
MIMDPVEAACEGLFKAMDGIGCTSRVLSEIIVCASNAELTGKSENPPFQPTGAAAARVAQEVRAPSGSHWWRRCGLRQPSRRGTRHATTAL